MLKSDISTIRKHPTSHEFVLSVSHRNTSDRKKGNREKRALKL